MKARRRFSTETRSQDWETVFLHEAMHGHYMQQSLAAENTSLPSMLRFEGPAAYFEGWALYS